MLKYWDGDKVSHYTEWMESATYDCIRDSSRTSKSLKGITVKSGSCSQSSGKFVVTGSHDKSIPRLGEARRTSKNVLLYILYSGIT